MSEPIIDGGPAFANLGFSSDRNFNGMSLRDYFAGQALAGMLSKQFGTMEENAHDAYFVADAMLKARAAK